MNVCYIIGAGEIDTLPTPKENDLVIAADGGYDYLTLHGVRCDLLIGDLDSIKAAPVGIEIIRHPVRKDETDMALAINEGARRGYTSFMLYGGTGGREEHTFANYALLADTAKRGFSTTLVSKKNRITAIKDSKITVYGAVGKGLSIFAFGGKAEGVSILGTDYVADNITLLPEVALGVSNSFAGDKAEICVKKGTLLVFIEN